MNMERGYLKCIRDKTMHLYWTPPVDKNVKWFLAGYQKLSFLDKIKLLVGYSLHVCFYTPSGKCDTACGLTYDVRKD